VVENAELDALDLGHVPASVLPRWARIVNLARESRNLAGGARRPGGRLFPRALLCYATGTDWRSVKRRRGKR
jgi:hypothetical protein